jgi:hypothetical protein
MDHSLDEKVSLMVIDVDADVLYPNTGHFGMGEFPRTISGQQYQDALHSDPLPPGDVFGFRVALCVIFPPSLQWIIWGERGPEIMALALADGFPDLSAEAIATSDVCLFTAEAALDISTPAWRDRAARVAFAEEFLRNYSNGGPYVDRPTTRALDAARRLIAGKVGVIEGCRELSSLRSAFGDPFAEDFRTFVAIDSATDDLPVGKVRQEWNPEALARHDIRIARCDEIYKQQVIEACRQLITRLRKL